MSSELINQLGGPKDTINDLGGVHAARATEMYFRLFFAMRDLFGSFDFTITVNRAGH